MVTKVGILILGALAFTGLTSIFIKTQQPENWAEKNSLTAEARRGKAKGKSEVIIPGPNVDYAGANMSINDALDKYSVVVAEPVENKSYSIDAFTITTWYRFKINEVISQKTRFHCFTCPQDSTPPADLGPIAPDEFLLNINGGTVPIDGVTVTVKNEEIPQFENGKKYVFFVSFVPGGIGRLAAGPAGIFKLDANDELEGVNVKKHRLYQEIVTRFDGKLSRLKSHVK